MVKMKMMMVMMMMMMMMTKMFENEYLDEEGNDVALNV